MMENQEGGKGGKTVGRSRREKKRKEGAKFRKESRMGSRREKHEGEAGGRSSRKMHVGESVGKSRMEEQEGEA